MKTKAKLFVSLLLALPLQGLAESKCEQLVSNILTERGSGTFSQPKLAQNRVQQANETFILSQKAMLDLAYPRNSHGINQDALKDVDALWAHYRMTPFKRDVLAKTEKQDFKSDDILLIGNSHYPVVEAYYKNGAMTGILANVKIDDSNVKPRAVMIALDESCNVKKVLSAPSRTESSDIEVTKETCATLSRYSEKQFADFTNWSKSAVYPVDNEVATFEPGLVGRHVFKVQSEKIVREASYGEISDVKIRSYVVDREKDSDIFREMDHSLLAVYARNRYVEAQKICNKFPDLLKN